MFISFLNIPLELRQLPNWCMWKFVDVGAEKLTKVPFNPKGYKASVNDPSTWSSFDDCFNAFSFGGWNGLGFMFSNSEYAGIDLDDDAGDPVIRERQLKIFHEFDSYSEVSPSGNGLHIIIKGSVLSGRRKSKIEIYSSGRFFTMTGNVFANKPIANRQELLTQLWEQMGGPTITSSFQGEEKQYLSDQQVIVQALNAANGEKFTLLNNGRWKDIYQSQSEADYAYIDIISFYSKNREQITRMFLASPLGQREKAKRPKYVYDMITKSFDNMPPNLDFDGFRNALEAKVAAQQQNEAQLQLPMIVPAETHKKHSIPLPPGLIGQIAQFIYAAAPLPVEEYALSGAIGLMAGITGRAYNISSTGLNQYVLMIGGTGCHAKGSKILMFDGSIKNVEDVEINDLLMGPDSQPRKVLSLARGKEAMAKITPIKGESFIVNRNHILSLVHTQHRDRINITVNDYLARHKTFKHCYKLERKAVDFPEIDLPLDPWFLGAMLGDGQLGPTIQLTSQDYAIRSRAANIIEHLGLEIRTSQIEGNKSFQDRYVKTSNKVRNQLRLIFEELGLWDVPCEYKFIPQIYKASHYEDRLAILAGLLDTDGSLTCNGYDYISKSKRLAEDVCFVARSVGLAAYIKEVEKYSQLGTGGIYYRVSMSGELSNLPMSLDYKKAKPRLQKKDVLVTGFKVELLPVDDFYGFALDKDHLYLTADFTVHHNTGKEQCSSGISKLINAVKMQVPTAGEFIGPSEISSGPALFKYMGNVNSFVSLLGEFGLRLQQLSNQHANGAEVSLRRMLLDLFNKSGIGDVLYKSVYSDKDKNTPDIQSPAFSIFGESTPERFYSALNEDMISEGLLPRFHIIEYKGNRVKRNKNHANVAPDFSLIDQLAGLCAHCMSLNHSQPRKVVNVGISEDALDILDRFDEHATEQINSANKNIVKELWNRAHIKTMKLAALIAVGVNFAAPVVQADHVNWAINLITNDIDNLTARFDAGEIGQAQYAETKQSLKIKKVIKDFVSLPFDKIKPYSSAENLHYHKIIPYGYMSRRLIADGSFTTDRVGATNAIKRTIQTLVDSDFLREVPKSDMMKFGTTQKAYVVTNLTLLD